MTLNEAILYSLIRTLTVASLAILPAGALIRFSESAGTSTTRRTLILLSLAPLFVPELLLGFTWRLAAARLADSLLATEAMYAALQLFRSVSVLFAARLLLADSAVTREALYSWDLLKPVAVTWRWRSTWLRLQLQGPQRAVVVGWSLAALLCFQEFETAALMQIDRSPITWTVWIFDAHAARQPLSDSLAMVVRPVTIELLLLVPCVVLLWSSCGRHGSFRESGRRKGSASVDSAKHLYVWPVTWLSLSLGSCVIWPVISNMVPILSRSSSIGMQAPLIGQSLQQILISLGFAAAAAVITLRLSAWLHSGQYTLLSVGLMLPGLAGPLFTGIALLAFFQSPLLHFLYDTWLPLLSGLCLSILPRAWLVVSLLNRTWDSEAVYSGQLLQKSPSFRVRRRSRNVIWQLRDARWLLAGLVVCHWCFWDVTIASILRPVQLEPIVTRLYNEMHYGRTEALTLIAMMAAAAAPLCALTAAWLWRTARIGMRQNT